AEMYRRALRSLLSRAGAARWSNPDRWARRDDAQRYLRDEQRSGEKSRTRENTRRPNREVSCEARAKQVVHSRGGDGRRFDAGLDRWEASRLFEIVRHWACDQIED